MEEADRAGLQGAHTGEEVTVWGTTLAGGYWLASASKPQASRAERNKLGSLHVCVCISVLDVTHAVPVALAVDVVIAVCVYAFSQRRCLYSLGKGVVLVDGT